MNPRQQAALAGAVTGGAVFLAFFYAWTKAKSADLQQIGQDASPAIAEQAVKDYISTRFGITPTRMQSLSRYITQIESLVNVVHSVPSR